MVRWKSSLPLFILRVESKPGQKKSIIDLINNPSVISSEVLRKEILYDDGSVQDLEEV